MMPSTMGALKPELGEHEHEDPEDEHEDHVFSCSGNMFEQANRIATAANIM